MSQQPFVVVRDDGPKQYIIHTDPRIGRLHEQHASQKCGGHLASITNDDEYEMVVTLMETTLGIDHDGIWLGGIQDMISNKENGVESDFEWIFPIINGQFKVVIIQLSSKTLRTH